MRITNFYNLPDAIVKACGEGKRKPSENYFSVTSLIDAPLIRQLTIKHYDELEEDVSDRLWALMGSSVHGVIENNLNPFSEMPLEIEIDGTTIRGRLDLLDEDKILRDWKCTSVYSFLLGDKLDWEQQLNIYAYILRKTRHEVRGLTINAILRDWSKRKAEMENDYPPIAFVEKQIELWTMERAEAFIRERIRLHQLPTPPPCTADEKWEKPTKYALMQKGRKRAIKLYSSQFEAETCCDKEKKQYVELRAGECTRCKSYCAVRKFCPEGIKTQKESEG